MSINGIACGICLKEYKKGVDFESVDLRDGKLSWKEINEKDCGCGLEQGKGDDPKA